jgi:hypothetical protein
MMIRVLAAFFASGGLNAGTPLAMAARGFGEGRRGEVVSRTGGGVHDADADGEQRRTDEEVRGNGEDVARLAHAPHVRGGHQDDDRRTQFHFVGLDRGEGGGQVGQRRRARDGDGHDVVDHQGRGGNEPEVGAEVLAGDDVGASAVGISTADLAVAEGDDGQHQRDRGGDEDRCVHPGRAGQDQDAQDLVGGVGG